MLLNIRNTATATITAIAVAAGAAAPANAFGSNERKFLQGIAAAVIVGTIINQSNRAQAAAPAVRPPVGRNVSRPAPEPEYLPDRRGNGRREHHDDRRENRRDSDDRYGRDEQRYQPPVRQGRIIGADNTGYSSGSALAQTPTARAFNSYSYEERRAVQRRLAAFGYYSGAIDGAFGPRTHQALYAFARTANRQSSLDSTSGTFAVIDALLLG